MSQQGHYKIWQCPDCGWFWPVEPDDKDPKCLYCIYGHSNTTMESLLRAARKRGARKPRREEAHYQVARCPFCLQWWQLPPDAPLPPECDCPPAKALRESGHLGKPDPFRRFIEDDLEFD